MTLKTQNILKVADIISGSTPKEIDTHSCQQGTIPFFRVGDMNTIGNEVFMNKAKINIKEEDANKLKLKICKKGTVIFPKRGGAIFTNKKRILAKDSAFDLNTMGLTPNEYVDDYFFYYWFNSLDLGELANGSSVPQLNNKQISPLEIPLPPIDQQKKIAAILDAADAYKQKTKALIEKYDELTQSLFLELFGDPVSNPMEWDKVALNELCDFKKTSVKPEEIETGDTYIGLECIEKQTGKILERFIVEAGEIKSNKFWFDSNYILYGKLRPYLNKVANPDFEGVCSTDIIPIRPILKNTVKEFIISLLRGSWFVSFADERCSGANLPRISPKEVEKYQTINPPLKLQNQFAERVQAIEAQKTQAQESLAKAEDLFNSLLQRAFKGELTN